MSATKDLLVSSNEMNNTFENFEEFYPPPPQIHSSPGYEQQYYHMDYYYETPPTGSSPDEMLLNCAPLSIESFNNNTLESYSSTGVTHMGADQTGYEGELIQQGGPFSINICNKMLTC